MPQFDQMHYDQKWSLWDTWKGVGRNIRAYAMTAGYKMGNIITVIPPRAAVAAEEEQLDGGGGDLDLHALGDAKLQGGQKLTISGRRVVSLSFSLKKVGSPSGAITFYIYRVSGGIELASKLYGDASSLTTDYALVEVTFDSPVSINEEVRIVCEFLNGNVSNHVALQYSTVDEKADEYMTVYYAFGWVDHTDGEDVFYKYSYFTIAPEAGSIFVITAQNRRTKVNTAGG